MFLKWGVQIRGSLPMKFSMFDSDLAIVALFSRSTYLLPAQPLDDGQALHRDPIPVVIPCHKVINGIGSPGGFGMGSDMRIRLLEHEGASASGLRTTMMLS
jgi:hypothetical protein